jgi:Isoprenylcysteine carboxyl methyltransferase (ICMT) family
MEHQVLLNIYFAVLWWLAPSERNFALCFGASVSQVAVRPADGHFPIHTTSPYQPGPLSQQSLSILSESRTPRWGLFSWSWYTMLFMLGAASWLWSFAQLGENFIFAIHKPQCLVKTGLYQYVQHPSYTEFFLLQGAVNLFISANNSGWVAGVRGDGKD